MAFFLYMAKNDPAFVKLLNPLEKAMLDGTFDVAIGTATFNWLIENNIERFGKDGQYFYVYAITKNRVVHLPTPFERPIGLQFSADQSIFNLDPAQPIRTAVTETALDKDIFVNLEIINRDDSPLDLAAAVSLLVHEFGHKLADKKNQEAIDSFAAKLENYLRSMVNTTEVNGKKVHLLRFKHFPHYDQLIENMLYGEYLGVNVPARVHFLSSFDKQGVYVWVDDHGKISDLSDTITAEVRKNAIVQYTDQKAYQFVRHNVVMAAALTVTAAGEESFKITLNSNLLQFVVPFMKSDSYDPWTYQLYERAFSMDPQWGAFFSYEYTLGMDNYQIKKVRSLPQIFDRPQFEVAFSIKRMKGSDLEIFYSIKGDRKLNLDSRLASTELWPELKIKIGNAEIVVQASDYFLESDEFKFVLKDFTKLSNEKVSVVGVQMRPRDQWLVVPNSDQVARLFLPSEQVLAEGSATQNSKPAPSLKALQIWDGTMWTPLKANSEIKEGMLLRFIFDSTEHMRELTIDQNYSVLNETTTSWGGKRLPGVGLQSEPHQRRLRFDDASMRQTVRDNHLHVDVNIDYKFAAEMKLGAPVLIDHSGVPHGGPLFGSGFIEHNVLSVENSRAITGISFVTVSGKANDFNFKNPLPFLKTPGADRPGPDSDKKARHYKKLQCIRLFY